MVLFLTVPSTVGLALLGVPIIRLIYEHGRFSPHATLETARALSRLRGRPGRLRGDQGRRARVLRARPHACAAHRQRRRRSPRTWLWNIATFRRFGHVGPGARHVDRGAGELRRAGCSRSERRSTASSRASCVLPFAKILGGGGVMAAAVWAVVVAARAVARRAAPRRSRSRRSCRSSSASASTSPPPARCGLEEATDAAQALPALSERLCCRASPQTRCVARERLVARGACGRGGRGSTASASRSGSSRRGSCRRRRRPPPARRTC